MNKHVKTFILFCHLKKVIVAVIILLDFHLNAIALVNTDSIINNAKSADRPALYLKYARMLSGSNASQAEVYINKALTFYRKTGDKYKEAEALAILGDIQNTKELYQESNNTLLKVIPVFQQKNENKGLAQILNTIGTNYFFTSAYKEAIEAFKKSIKYSQNHYPREEGRSHLYIGLSLRALNELDSAQEEIVNSLLFFSKVDSVKDLAMAHFYLGLVYFERDLFKKSIEHYELADSLRVLIHDIEGRGKIRINIGNVYLKWGKYEKSIAAYQDAIKIFEKFGNKPGIANCLSNIGIVYNKIDDEESSLIYHNQALDIRKQLNDYTGIARSLNNIAIVKSKSKASVLEKKYGKNWQDNAYKKTGSAVILKMFTEALTYFRESLRIYDSINNLSGIAETYYNIGIIYANAGDFKEAEKNYKKAIEVCSISDNIVYAAVIKISIGYTYVQTSKYELALQTYNEALEVFKKKKLNDYLKEVYEKLSSLYEVKGNTTKALAYYKLFTEIKDTLLNAENYKMLKSIQTEFETEQKEQQIKYFEKDAALKEVKIKQQFYFILFFILLSILVGALVVLFYRQSKQRKLTNQQLEIKNELITGQKKEITDSIQYASRLQQAILPPDEVLAKHIPDHFLFFRPRDIVSGDFYYVAEKDGKIVVVTADCTGHGVPGALMSMIGTSILNEIINKHEVIKPDVILNEMRLHIIKSLHQSGKTGEHRDGMDLALYILDRKENKLEFAGANNPLIIVRKGELIEIKPDKMPIGIYEKGLTPFKATSMPVMDKDMLYTFSDGICDQFGGTEGKKFLSKRLKELLVSIHALELAEQKEKINEAFQNWKGTHEQVDDVLVIGVRV